MGEEPRIVFKEKYSGAGLFMLKSLKLNAPGPKLFVADRLELLRELYMSLQFHGMREGGCMAASGEEASMVAAIVTRLPQTYRPNCNKYRQVVYGRYSNVLKTEECNRYKPINYERCVGKMQDKSKRCNAKVRSTYPIVI